MHAAYTGGTTVLNAVTGGADLKTIATLTNKLGYDVMAGPNIKTAKDLRGLSSLDTELGDDASPAILSFPRTRESSIIVTPVQTGVHPHCSTWIPFFNGMTAAVRHLDAGFHRYDGA